jgi:hypothetical protein
MEMFVNRILMLMSIKLTSHSRYELLEIEANSKTAIQTYEAFVLVNILLIINMMKNKSDRQRH